MPERLSLFFFFRFVCLYVNCWDIAGMGLLFVSHFIYPERIACKSNSTNADIYAHFFARDILFYTFLHTFHSRNLQSIDKHSLTHSFTCTRICYIFTHTIRFPRCERVGLVFIQFNSIEFISSAYSFCRAHQVLEFQNPHKKLLLFLLYFTLN